MLHQKRVQKKVATNTSNNLGAKSQKLRLTQGKQQHNQSQKSKTPLASASIDTYAP